MFARSTSLLIVLFLFNLSLIAQNLADDIDQFYLQYIVNGKVDYDEIKQHTTEFERLISAVKKTNWESFDKNGQQAFLINAYNLYVIKAVIDRYPIKSTKAVNGFFTQKKYRLADKVYSLDQIEKDLLFGIKRDPRFHFVLICGANGCPPFWPKAFRSAPLESQLEEASKACINSNWVQVENEKLMLSEIFGWYGFDFGNVQAYVNKYRNENIPSDLPMSFYEYDWGLNELVKLGSIQQPFLTASQLMSVGTWELKAFQSVYTQVDRNGFDRDNSRSTYYSSFNQFILGLKPGLNVGLDIVWKKNYLNDRSDNHWAAVFSTPTGRSSLSLIPCDDPNANFPEGSPCNTNGSGQSFDLLQNADGDTLIFQIDQGLAHLGPKVRFNFFKKFPELTTQQTLYIPIDKSVDGQLISFTQFFYEHRLGSKASLFTELSFWMPIRPSFKVFPFAKTFWSYFPNRHVSLYAMLSLPGEYGAGMKINLTRRLELEVLATKYLSVERFFGDRKASTINIGLRLHP